MLRSSLAHLLTHPDPTHLYCNSFMPLRLHYNDKRHLMQTDMQEMLLAAVTPQGVQLDQVLYTATSADSAIKTTA